MSRYDDYRSSTGTLDSRDRYERYRGPPVAERSRRVEDERFEFRMKEEDRYGPPARAPGRRYDDEHLVHTSGPLVAQDRRRRDESPTFVRPRLLRRQSSLDTFDRIPRRKMEEVRDRAPRRKGIPTAPPPPRASPGRYREREIYEDIRIADPDTYGDEKYRDMYDQESMGGLRRSSSARRRHHVEKPYPRKGKTRIPRKWVHIHAILDIGYPFKEEGDTIVIQKALSKEQIDEVISLSREFRRPAQVETEYLRIASSPHREVPRERVTTEHLVVDSHSHHSPRSSHDAFIVEASPSRTPDYDYDYDDDYNYDYEEVVERPRRHTVSRPRSVSVHAYRHASPVRFVEPREYVEERVGTSGHSGSMVLVRPRHNDYDTSDYIDDLEEESRLLRLERQGGIEITRQRETDIIDSRGNEEEVTEIRRSERREPNSRVMRAMMATLT